MSSLEGVPGWFCSSYVYTIDEIMLCPDRIFRYERADGLIIYLPVTVGMWLIGDVRTCRSPIQVAIKALRHAQAI